MSNSLILNAQSINGMGVIWGRLLFTSPHVSDPALSIFRTLAHSLFKRLDAALSFHCSLIGV